MLPIAITYSTYSPYWDAGASDDDSEVPDNLDWAWEGMQEGRRRMKPEEQPITPIEAVDLLVRVSALCNEGYRIVAISTTKLDELFQVDYSFDRDLSFRTLRLLIPLGTELPSITGIFWAAFPYENEMHDLFGITVTGMALDFNGTFITTAIQHPFNVNTDKPEDDACQTR